jgi:hypothetical protein
MSNRYDLTRSPVVCLVTSEEPLPHEMIGTVLADLARAVEVAAAALTARHVRGTCGASGGGDLRLLGEPSTWPS